MVPDRELIHLLSSQSPIIMGIINATPDSFYDSGANEASLPMLIDTFQQLNVDIIDLGAESSRPGATPIDSAEEIKRLREPLQYAQLKSTSVISVDTYKAETADFALSNGASIINDITGGESDDLLNVVAKHDAAIILMHKQGLPSNMQDNPTYHDVIGEIKTIYQNKLKKQRPLALRQSSLIRELVLEKLWSTTY